MCTARQDEYREVRLRRFIEEKVNKSSAFRLQISNQSNTANSVCPPATKTQHSCSQRTVDTVSQAQRLLNRAELSEAANTAKNNEDTAIINHWLRTDALQEVRLNVYVPNSLPLVTASVKSHGSAALM